MIDLYTFTTPNGRKASIALEEMGLPYEAHTIDITNDEQFAPDFLKISPNNKIPAIKDRETGQSLFESGAILLYLVNKTGMFMPDNEEDRWRAMEWLMWQMGNYGPMLGQANHFLHFNPDASGYASERYGKEANRLTKVLDNRLSEAEYVAGDYSIADMAIFPWTAAFGYNKVDLNEYPNVLRWYKTIAERPAVQRGFAVPKEAEIPVP